MGRVVHFEIFADDIDRAISFYSDVFQWQFMKWDGPGDYWLVTTGMDNEPGINGGLMQRPKSVDISIPNAFVCSVEVEDVEDTVERVKAAGGAHTSKINDIPGIGRHTYFMDTEGNQLGAIENF